MFDWCEMQFSSKNNIPKHQKLQEILLDMFWHLLLLADAPNTKGKIISCRIGKSDADVQKGREMHMRGERGERPSQ